LSAKSTTAKGVQKAHEVMCAQLSDHLRALPTNPHLLAIITQIARPHQDANQILNVSPEQIGAMICSKIRECIEKEYLARGELSQIGCALLGISRQALDASLQKALQGHLPSDVQLRNVDTLRLDNPAHYMPGVQAIFKALFSLSDGFLSWKKWLFDVVDADLSDLCAQQELVWPGLGTIEVVLPEPNPYRHFDRKKAGEGLPAGAKKERLEKEAQQAMALRRIIAAFSNQRFGKFDWGALESKAQFGGYLFSAIVFSGVQDLGRLKQIAELSLAKEELDAPYSSLLLPRNQKLRMDAAYVALEKARKESKSKAPRHTKEYGPDLSRWIADPLTAALHSHYRKNWIFTDRGPKFASDCLKAFMGALKGGLRIQKTPNEMGMDQDTLFEAIDLLSTRKALMYATQSWQEDTLPTFIARYLAGRIFTKDLQIENLLQLGMSDAQMPTAKITKENRDDAWSDGEDEIEVREGEANSQAPSPVAMQWIEQILEAISHLSYEVPPSQERCLGAIEEIEKRYQLSEQRLTRSLLKWVRHLIMQDWASKGLTTEILTSYLHLILPLAMAAWDLDEGLDEFTAEDWGEEFVELYVQLTTPKDQKIFKAAWESLRKNQLTEAEKGLRPESQVDVGYLTELEFRWAQIDLYTVACRKLPLEYKNACLIIFTLSYRLGLRRSEVLKLATTHVHIKTGWPTEISVQWWKHRRLKTASSVRMLPVEALLDPRELNWLKLWTAAREQGALCIDEPIKIEAPEFKIGPLGGKTKLPEPELYAVRELEFLFPVPMSAKVREEQSLEITSNTEREKIIDYIHESMRWVTKNPYIRFHHLRHSAAMNALMLLCAPRLPNSERFILDHLYGNKEIQARIARDHGAVGMADGSNPILQIKNLKRRMGYARYFLLNDSRASPSELYVVSTLLGHSSPATTLYSYIHVIDVLTGAFLHERLLRLNPGLLNALYPGTKRNLDIRRKRCKTPFDDPKAGLNKVPVLLNEVMSPGPKIQKQASMHLNLVQILNPEAGRGIEWACDSFERLVSTDEKQFAKTAALLDIPEELARQWISNATAFTNQGNLYAPDRKYLYENLPDPLPKAFIVKKLRMRGGIKSADQWLTKAIVYFEIHPDEIFILLDYAKERVRARADKIKFTQKELGTGQYKRKGAAISNPIKQSYMKFLDALEINYVQAGKNSLELKCGAKATDDLPIAYRRMMILLGTIFTGC
jgi:integrase